MLVVAFARISAFIAIFILAFSGGRATEALADGLLERGAYLAAIMDCTGCHTPGALAGAPDPSRYLNGSDIGFMIPGVGVFYPPNLTSDPETGIGTWSEDDIIAAVRTGVRPDGRALVAIMPFPSYAMLTDDDAKALATYLRSLPPARNKSPGPFGKDETPSRPYLMPVIPK